jgi:hypothetical protein
MNNGKVLQAVACLLCAAVAWKFSILGLVGTEFSGGALTPGDYSVHAQGIFVWNGWAVLGMVTLAIVVYLSLHSVTANRVKFGNGV